jgi:hypothetical protein
MAIDDEAGSTDRLRVGSLTFEYENGSRILAMVLSGPKRHTQKMGDISEQAAITRLLQCSYIVLQPIGQMHRYGLVIEDADGKYWRVQVKTGWLNEDQSIIKFATASSMNYTV